MKRLLPILLALAAFLALQVSCFPISPTPGGSGGQPAVGGSPATGGTGSGGETPSAGAPSSTGGVSATGGTASMGGSQATGGATIALPTCPATAKRKTQVEMPLSGWRPDPGWQAQIKLDAPVRSKMRLTAAEATVWWRTNLMAALDQGSVGACVGFGTAGISSTKPFGRVASNSDGLRAYSVSTRIDNGCSPMGLENCSGAYPPTDNGSYSSSGMKAGVALGWFKSWVSVPDVPTLLQRIQKGPCGVGKVWRQDEFSPSRDVTTCGRLSQTGAVRGGHFEALPAVVVETTPRRIYTHNSWGNDWGACLDGVCGFAYLDEPDLVALVAAREAEIVCAAP